MAQKSAHDFVAASVDLLGERANALGGTTKHAKWELESHIIAAMHFLNHVEEDYRAWQTRVVKKEQPFSLHRLEEYRTVFRNLLEMFKTTESAIDHMNKDIDGHVSNCNQVYIDILRLGSLLGDKWAPIAPVSAVFEEDEVDGEDAAMLSEMLSQAG